MSTTEIGEDPPAERSGRLTRRRLLAGAGAGIAGIALFGGGAAAGADVYGGSSSSGSSSAATGGDALSFRSRPDLYPPRIQLTDVGAPPTDEVYLIGPNEGPAQQGTSQPGLMILDQRGSIVWFDPITAHSFSDLRVQTYRGEPVLTWWQGKFVSAGFGRGEGIIADTSYRQIATVKALGGLEVDLHEFLLTPSGTALVTAYATTSADLSSRGGPSKGSVYEGVVQEIDVATGKLLFEWRSLDHVGVDESESDAGSGIFDYFHVNSIAVDPADGNFLISSRNTWTIYKVARSTGAVLWRLGGRNSDFEMGAGTAFAWQHDANILEDGTLTVFDDGASPAVQTQSRGLHLAIDTTTSKATLLTAFVHPARLLAENQGSVQMLPDGGAVVGWGSEPYFSEFAADGTLVFDARLPTDQESYRAFRSAWSATPTTVPDIAVEADNVGGHTAYVSWNGATDVATWQAVTGDSAQTLVDSGSVPKSGFETAMTVHASGSFLAMRALDAQGATLATSRTVRL